MRREQQVIEDIETLQRRLRSPTQGLYGWRAVVRSRRRDGGTDHLQFHQGPKEGPARRHYHKSLARPGLIAEHLRPVCVKTLVDEHGRCYSFSNPWVENFSVRLFSVTVRTIWSEAPSGSLA